MSGRPSRLLAATLTAVAAAVMGAVGVAVTPPAVAGLDDYVPPDGHATTFVSNSGGVAQVQTTTRIGWTFGLSEPAVTPDAWALMYDQGSPHDAWIVERYIGDYDATTLWSVGPEGREVIAVVSADMAVDYPEGRLDAPAGDPVRWRDSGPVSATVAGSRTDGTYFLHAEAREAGRGCRTVRYTETLTFPGSDPVETVREETRCPGRGLVAFDDGSAAWSAAAVPPAREFSTVTQAQPAPDVPTELVPLSFPDHPGFLDLYEAALPAGRERVVMVVDLTEDLYSLNRSGDELRMGWVVHPGGIVTGFGVFGDLTVAATSQLTASAYDAEGFRIWKVDLPEECPAGPVRLDDDSILFGCRDGTLRALSLQDGSTEWSVQAPAEIQLDPVAADGTVIAVDILANVIAVRDGEILWTEPLEGPVTSLAVPRHGLHALISELGSTTVLRLDLATGETSEAGYVPSVHELYPLADGALAVSFEQVASVGTPAGPTYAGDINSVTSTPVAALLDADGEILVVTTSGQQVLGSLPSEGDLYTFWAEGDGEWLLSTGGGFLWSVR